MSATSRHATAQLDGVHRVLPESVRQMAKADLRKTESADYRARIAHAVDRATEHLLLKELADHIERATGRKYDERQLARWKTGSERPQFDVLFAVDLVAPRLAVELCALCGSRVEIETVVRVRGAA